MIGKAFCNLWRAAITLLLLLTVATHASQPSDFDFDLHPAPFSAYDDDVVRASIGPSRSAADLKAVQDVEGDNGKLPAPRLAIHSPTDVQFLAASGGRSIWLVSSAAEALRGAARSPYLARGPPPA